LQVVRQLRDARKLRTVEDEPDAPAYVRDRTPLRRGQISTAGLRDEFRRDAALPMLVGDDIFVRGIRLGVERGEFVYRKHDLVYGKGDPHTPISVEEEAVVFTMAYAVEHKIWPRPEKQRPPDSPVQPVDPSAQPPSYPPAPETRTGPVMEPGSQTSPGDTLRAEGVLREALNRIFEQAVARKVALLAQMSIRVFETADGFRLLGVMGAIRSAETRLELSAEFETPQGSEVKVEFNGVPQDALPLRDFLDPQLRLAAEKKFEVKFILGFKDGLATSGEPAAKLVEQLTRFATGAAYVEASAEPRS
jgi:hypothetical protein